MVYTYVYDFQISKNSFILPGENTNFNPLQPYFTSYTIYAV